VLSLSHSVFFSLPACIFWGKESWLRNERGDCCCLSLCKVVGRLLVFAPIRVLIESAFLACGLSSTHPTFYTSLAPKYRSLFFSVLQSSTREMIVLRVDTSCVVSYRFQFFLFVWSMPSARRNNSTCHNTLGVAIPVYAHTVSYFWWILLAAFHPSSFAKWVSG